MSATHVIVYGIPNCDSVKKARTWFASQSIPFEFHDFKKQGLPAEALNRWTAAVGWQKLVNRSGTTWRKLDPAAQAAVIDEASAGKLMADQPSVIKRPVVELHDEQQPSVTVGYVPQQWEAWLQDRT